MIGTRIEGWAPDTLSREKVYVREEKAVERKNACGLQHDLKSSDFGQNNVRNEIYHGRDTLWATLQRASHKAGVEFHTLRVKCGGKDKVSKRSKIP